jgi:hypothetical protein
MALHCTQILPREKVLGLHYSYFEMATSRNHTPFSLSDPE